MARLPFRRLQKELALFDVYVISTGAMISSGFFLLPGIAAGYAGAAVVAAYLLSALLVIPAMVSIAELATAMPRAGGPYYFLDRTLGPLVGTVGGVGTWLSLVLKSGFGLIGMGAYLTLVLDVPVIPTAITLAVLFGLLNAVGAKESTRLLRPLVLALLAVLVVVLGRGLGDALGGAGRFPWPDALVPDDVDGLLSAAGLVFVAYIGLTKVVSLAEEIENPERNIPLGLALGLLTVTTVYVLGVTLMVTLLGPSRMAESLTPAAALMQAMDGWPAGTVGRWLIVAAAVAAFASMSNAGILAASRYPLAMARDKLFPDFFAATGRSGAPLAGVALTCGLLILFLLALDVAQVAKLASALQLIIFGLLNVAVIVMRESHIESYDPGFRSPLYPWLQLVGLIVPLVLVAEMGWLPVLFSMGVIALCFGWYTYYASRRIEREGALYHVFARLGRRRFKGLDRELRDIMKEKGARSEDPFDEVVTRASVIDVAQRAPLEDLVRLASKRLASVLPATAQQLEGRFGRGLQMGGTPVAHGVALLHTRLPRLDGSELVLVRCPGGVELDAGAGPAQQELAREAAGAPIRAVFFLVSGQADPGRHLRLLAHLAGRVEDEDFMDAWLASRGEQELKEVLLRDERFLSLTVSAGARSAELIGRALHTLRMPEGSLIALIQRDGAAIVPRGRTVLREGDRLTVIGDPQGIQELMRRYGETRGDPGSR